MILRHYVTQTRTLREVQGETKQQGILSSSKEILYAGFPTQWVRVELTPTDARLRRLRRPRVFHQRGATRGGFTHLV